LQAAVISGTLERFIEKSVDDFLSSKKYRDIVMREQYYLGENPTLAAYLSRLEMDSETVDLFAKIRVPSGIFNRIITLLVNRLWFNGVQLDTPELKKKLGDNFDKTAKDIATKAAVHGACYGFWNNDFIQLFAATEYFPLADERTGAHMAGIRAYTNEPEDENHPWVIQLFEIDGYTEWSRVGTKPLKLFMPKRSYKRTVRRDALGEEVIGGENYPSYPVLPMYANTEHKSELSPPIKQKIDLYDALYTTFGDMSLRTKVLYWLLEGMSGNEEHLKSIKETIERLGIIAPRGDAKASAENVSLPYKEFMEFLDDIEDTIFSDAMIANPKKITGGAITATAISAYYHAEKLKVSDAEWNGWDFINRLLKLLGLESDKIEFKHETISSDMEITQRVNQYNLPIEIAMELDPLFKDDAIPKYLDIIAKESLGMSSKDEEDEELTGGDDTDGRRNYIDE